MKLPKAKMFNIRNYYIVGYYTNDKGNIICNFHLFKTIIKALYFKRKIK